jgi:hypothetical protein
MPFTDDQLKAALAEASPRWKFVPGTRYREMPQTFALQLLAVAATYEPNRIVEGVTLSAALLEKLHLLLGGLPADDAEGNTREPEAQGGIGGWTHAAAAWVLLMAKRLPGVWAQLSDDEKHRADLIMLSLAVAGHFTMSDANTYHVLLDGTSNHHKSWNINITEGYVDVLIVAGLYFGAAELNALFRNFDFDAFVADADRMGLRNLVRCWTHRPFIRDLLMHGGAYFLPGGKGPVPGGGVTSHGAGVRCECYFQGHSLDETWAIFRTQATRQFCKAVRTEVNAMIGESTRLLQRVTPAQTSPWEGRMGMCMEFEASDWYGIRSCLTYAYEGVMILLGTAAGLRALGLWPDDASGRYLEQCMAVGISDLQFKGREGYRGWAHGKEIIEDYSVMRERGADYIFPMWSELFPPAEVPA